MRAGDNIEGTVLDRYVEVDATRLLLILAKFQEPVRPDGRVFLSRPPSPLVGHFTPEYRLQKLDFLLRYPSYVAYELMQKAQDGEVPATEREEVARIVASILREGEPDLLTQPFRRFWHGAYERIDDVEVWWYSRDLVYTGFERRGNAPPQKHYYLTQAAVDVVSRLQSEVPEVDWYQVRICLLHRFFGQAKPSDLAARQYAHDSYRDARLGDIIPDLRSERLAARYSEVFGEGPDGGN